MHDTLTERFIQHDDDFGQIVGEDDALLAGVLRQYHQRCAMDDRAFRLAGARRGRQRQCQDQAGNRAARAQTAGSRADRRQRHARFHDAWRCERCPAQAASSRSRRSPSSTAGAAALSGVQVDAVHACSCNQSSTAFKGAGSFQMHSVRWRGESATHTRPVPTSRDPGQHYTERRRASSSLANPSGDRRRRRGAPSRSSPAPPLRLRLLAVPLERDEGEYAYMGQLILRGETPYLGRPQHEAARHLLCLRRHPRPARRDRRRHPAGPAGDHLVSIALLYLLGRRLLDVTAGLTAAAAYAVLSLSQAVAASPPRPSTSSCCRCWPACCC